jgi:hypothetical protein
MLPPSLAACKRHPLLTQQDFIIVSLRQHVKGCLPVCVWEGVREVVLVATRMVTVRWMVASWS